MKLIFRTLIILALAVGVCGVSFIVVNQLGFTAGGGEFEGRGSGGFGDEVGEFTPPSNNTTQSDSAQASGTQSNLPTRDRPERGEGREGRGSFGMLEVLKPLVIIAVIVLIVAPCTYLFRGRKREVEASSV